MGHKEPMITLEGSSNFLANGHVVLSSVPCNVTTVAPATTTGCFVGFNTIEAKSRHVVPIGKPKNIRFMSIFRFKVWWTTHWTGSAGGDLEHETQMVLLDKSGDGRPYVLLLPLLEGPFRASLQPGSDDFIDICVESKGFQIQRDREKKGGGLSVCLT